MPNAPRTMRIRTLRKRYDDRKTSAQRGYGYRWQQARASFLRHHPLCCQCARIGRTQAATVVDHVVPHRGDQALFWDDRNWQALCKACHDRKTASEDGGFGGNRANATPTPSSVATGADMERMR